jgi:hypothetical protein
MASSEDFDQTKYTEAAWATLAALPACAESYMSTSVEAPMLLAILLNPTKYQAGEYSIQECGGIHDNLRNQIDELYVHSTLFNMHHRTGESAMTAKQVAMQLLEDAGVNVQQLRNDVEAYLERHPKVTLGDGVSQQKSMGRVLAEVLQAGREIKSELKVSSKDVGNDLLTLLPIVSFLPTQSIHAQCVRRTPTSPRNPSSSVSAPATLSSPSKPYNPKVLHSTT